MYVSVAKMQKKIDDTVNKKQQEIEALYVSVAKKQQEIDDSVAEKKQEIEAFVDKATVTQSLACEGLVVKLVVTTGKPSDSKSGMGPKILFAPVGPGNWAQASITASNLPGRGLDDAFSVELPAHFQSGVKGFTIEATNIDGWLISSLSIQIGDGPVKILNLGGTGETGVWLDGLPYNNDPDTMYLGLPYHNFWTFEDLDAFPTNTEMTDKSDFFDDITVLADFEKMPELN
jgi:hypothetical protein